MGLGYITTHTLAGVFQQDLVTDGLLSLSIRIRVIGDLTAIVTVIVMAIIMVTTVVTTMATGQVMQGVDTIHEICTATGRVHDQQLVADHQLSR